MSEADLTQFILAGSLCVLAALIGFNRPSWSRSYTTASRYRTALLIHAVFYGVVFLATYFVIRKLGWIELPAAEAAWLAALVVLALRILWPWPKAWLHETAGIPQCAHRLAAVLADSALNPDDETAEAVHATLLSRGIEVGADWLPIAQPTHKLLVKATTLFLQIRKWEQQRQYTRFLREAKNDVDLLRRRFDRLSFRVSRSLASIERLGEVRHLYSAQSGRSDAPQIDNLLRKIVGDLLADSCEDIRAFHEDACLLTARAVLTTQGTRKGRCALLRSLGFEVTRQFEKASYGFLITPAVLLYAGLWLIFELRPAPDTGGVAPAYLSPLISLIVFGALVIAIVPKLHWGFANAGLRPRTPLIFVLGAGLCAMLFAALVQLSAGALLIGGMEGALERLYRGSPWIPGMFIIASTMAWLVQDHRWQRAPSAIMRRLLDALTFGTAWVAAGVLGALLRAQMFESAIQPSRVLWSSVGGFVLAAVISQFTAECVRETSWRKPSPRTSTRLADIPFAKPRPATA